MLVYHVSEISDITLFEPRPAPSGSKVSGDIVWAVDNEHISNYLLPRDCPRVCLSRNNKTSEEDAEKFFSHSSANRIICVEWDWLSAIRETTLYVYHLDATPFECIDSGAGYYVARQSLKPISSTVISDILCELKACEVELRFMPDLWAIHDSAAKSTLEFSMIRMRNAKLRQ